MTQTKVSLVTRFLRIPTRWEIHRVAPQWQYFRYSFDFESHKRVRNAIPVAVPFLDTDAAKELTEIDGWELRNRFLQLKQSEEAAVDFLHKVGVWGIMPDPHISGLDTGVLDGAFGSRFVQGWAVPVALSEFWDTQKGYHDLLGDPQRMRKRFGIPPFAKGRTDESAGFALQTTFENFLSVHIEWRNGRPVAIVEGITFHDVMMATTQIDLLQGARFRYCRRRDCHIPFAVTTKHRRKYCSWYCGHIESVRRSRKH